MASASEPQHRFSSHRLRSATAIFAVAAVALGLASATPAAADTAPSSFQTANDYCLGQCNDVMPPGENGNANIVDILGNKLLKTQPPHTSDQLASTTNCSTATTTSATPKSATSSTTRPSGCHPTRWRA